MPYKDDELRRAMQRKYSNDFYQRNRLKVIENIQQYKRQKREEFTAFKASLSCQMCGLTGIPDAIDFHHVDPKDGDSKVYKLLRNGAFSKAYREIKKCVPLCATCHRIVHAEEKLLQQVKTQPSYDDAPPKTHTEHNGEDPSGA